MALISPGVEVSIIDESNYIPAGTNSVPYILIATAQNKVSGTGTGVASGTLASNANKVYLITSQRDLVTTFGNPFFYKTSNGTPINGYELNEYGLLTAYSVLGVSNRAYVQRVDVDLAALTASLSRPTGDPDNGAWWFDTAESREGFFEWNETTQAFTNVIPIMITSTDDLTSGVPKASIGSIGDYAVVATNTNNPTYFKNTSNDWVLVGSDDWKNSWAAITSPNTSPTLTNGNSIKLNDSIVTCTGTTITTFASNINSAAIAGITAAVVNNKLVIYIDSAATNDGSTADGGVLAIDNNSGTLLTALGITADEYYAPSLQQSAHTVVPRWRTTDNEPHPTGSLWFKTTSVNLGASLIVKQYDATTDVFNQVACPLYVDQPSANKTLDPGTNGGGKNIPAGSLFAQYDFNEDNTLTFKFLERAATGSTTITGSLTNPTFVVGETFTVQVSAANSTALSSAVTVTLSGTTAESFVADFTAANIPNTIARILNTGAIQLTHTQGGLFVFVEQGSPSVPIQDAGFIPGETTGVTDGPNDEIILSNWIPMGGTDAYTANDVAPDQNPANGTPWYYSDSSVADIMINDGSAWKGYRTVTNDVRGFNLVNTDPEGPIFAATAPITQSDTTALVNGDLWIDTGDLENYPAIYRWQTVEGVDQWVLIDTSDQTTENGILFADARWGINGTTDPVAGDLPEIADMLTSNYLDIDKPDYTLYPTGTLLFNTRRSGFNVKEFRVNYFNASDFPDDTLPTEKDTWVTVSGNQDNGAAYMGRKAVRQMVLQAMKAGIDTNTDAREEQRAFNLIACPGYPELAANMINLNNDRNNTAFVVADTPMRLAANGTDILTWVTNDNGNGVEDAITQRDPYIGVFYPSCQANDLSGSTVVQPPSHMMLRTLIRSDEIAFPWLAPAGTRRGTVDNATQLGYIDATTGEFQTTAIRVGLRDTLYENDINPITFIPGTGILNYGNKTYYGVDSALDRINVARLIAYIRGRLQSIANSFLFEPNDKITRDEVKNSVEGLMNDLLAKRGIYDYLVVCDESNNTPSRIDRNELYLDIAIEPVKAVEFIYIPVRIKNTGSISAGT